MSLPPTNGHGGFSGSFPDMSRFVDGLYREAAYDRADSAAEIGLKYDEIKVLVEQLLREAQNLPSPEAAAYATGASSSVAESFARPLNDTMTMVRFATYKVNMQVQSVSKAVLKTIEELSQTDAEASDVLRGTSAKVEETSSRLSPTTIIATGGTTLKTTNEATPSTTSFVGSRGPGASA